MIQRKNKTKIKSKAPPIKTQEEIPVLPFHLAFPFHLSYKDKNEQRDCYFKDEIDLNKYIKRYKLKPKTYVVTNTEPRS